MPEYPFEPKSNTHLLPGQFWGVPLSDGRWACGRVLAVKTQSDAYFPGNSRTILGRRDLGLDGIRGLREVTHRGGGTVMVYEGRLRSGPQHVRKRPPCRSSRHGVLKSSRCWRSAYS